MDARAENKRYGDPRGVIPKTWVGHFIAPRKKDRRKRSGDFARLMGVHRATVKRWIDGTSYMSNSRLCQASAVLGVSVFHLLGYDVRHNGDARTREGLYLLPWQNDGPFDSPQLSMPTKLSLGDREQVRRVHGYFSSLTDEEIDADNRPLERLRYLLGMPGAGAGQLRERFYTLDVDMRDLGQLARCMADECGAVTAISTLEREVLKVRAEMDGKTMQNAREYLDNIAFLEQEAAEDARRWAELAENEGW